MTELKISITEFSTLVDLIEKVVIGLIKIPKEERDEYQALMNDTFVTVNTILNLLLFRLGDISLLDDDCDFLYMVRRLDNNLDWLEAEHKLRICRPLRKMCFELLQKNKSTFWGISPLKNDWNAMIENMKPIFTSCKDVADYLSGEFSDIAKQARGSQSQIPQMRNRIIQISDSLREARKKLMQAEAKSINIYSP